MTICQVIERFLPSSMSIKKYMNSKPRENTSRYKDTDKRKWDVLNKNEGSYVKIKFRKIN